MTGVQTCALPISTMLRGWDEVLILECSVLFFAKHNASHLNQNVYLSTEQQELSCSSTWSLANFRKAAMFFLESSGFLLAILPCTPCLFSVCLMVDSLTLTLANARGACRSLDVTLGFFVTSWNIIRLAFGVISAGQPLLGRVTMVLNFLQL